MGNEFVGEDGGIGVDLDEVNGHRRHFGKDDAAQGIREGEVDVGEGKIYGILGCLGRCQSRALGRWFVEAVPL